MRRLVTPLAVLVALSSPAKAQLVELPRLPQYNCLTVTQLLFGLVRWSSDDSKCEAYALARINEQAAAAAETEQIAGFYLRRADAWRDKAESADSVATKQGQ